MDGENRVADFRVAKSRNPGREDETSNIQVNCNSPSKSINRLGFEKIFLSLLLVCFDVAFVIIAPKPH